jgi:hypothetical protein
MEYGRSYGEYAKLFIPTCYRYGARIWCDPARKTDTIIGTSLEQAVYEANPVRPHEQIEYDWHRGHLIFDAPGVAGYVGFFGQRCGMPVTFKNGAVFKDVTVLNPQEMPYPVTPEEGYVAIVVTSADGKPLASTKKAVISAVSTSLNSGFQVDTTRGCSGRQDAGPVNRKPAPGFGAWCLPGKEPALVARVGVTIECPAIDGMKYAFRDWHGDVIESGAIASGTLRISAEKPVFFIDLTR